MEKVSKLGRPPKKQREWKGEHVPLKKDFKQNWIVYLIFLPVFIYFFITCYLPMFGITMAFQDFDMVKGFFNSQWVGFDNFIELFTGDAFPTAFRNTMIMALFSSTLGFVAPILFALLLSSVRNKKYRRVTQTVSYLPNFVAVMVVATLVQQFLAEGGAISAILSMFGLQDQNWLANPNPPVFWLINCLSGIWQGFGYGFIIYVAAISNINGDYYEAAAIDGANSWQRMWKITLPSIMPMILMMFILQMGVVTRVGFDKVLLLYMPQTFNVADNLYTYTYRMAFGFPPDYGLGAASGLFQSVLGTVLLVISNWLSKKSGKLKLF